MEYKNNLFLTFKSLFLLLSVLIILFGKFRKIASKELKNFKRIFLHVRDESVKYNKYNFVNN